MDNYYSNIPKDLQEELDTELREKYLNRIFQEKL